MHPPAPPPWLVDMPDLHHQRARAFRSLPSHAASHWVDGKPIFSVDARKVRILAIRGRCWLCGYPLASPGYVVSTETDRNYLYGHLFSQAFGPAHHSCVLYSAAACPFLRYRKARRRITGQSPRGTATIKSFNRFGVFFPPSPIAFMVFGYWTATETIPLTNPTHIADLYAQAVTADAATNFTATPRLYWTDTSDDLRRLRTDWSQAMTNLRAWGRTSVVTIDGYTYRGEAIVPSRPS